MMHLRNTLFRPQRSTLKFCFCCLALLAVFASSSSYADSASAFAGTCANVPSGDVDWVNADNAQGASDGVGATVLLSTPGATFADYILCTNFSFTIPSGSRIDGITVKLVRKASLAEAMYSRQVSANRLGSNSSNGGYWGTGFGNDEFGPSLWGLSWTAAEINDSSFGFRTKAEYFNNPVDPITGTLDSMEIIVHYTPEEFFEDGFETPE